MKSALVLGLLSSLVMLVNGCSDDGTPADSGPKPEAAAPDQGRDGAMDALTDAPGDAGEQMNGDAPSQGEGGVDLAPAEVGPADGPLPDMGTPNLSGTITRTVAPILDAKGNIHIGLSVFPPPALFQLAGIVLKNEHLVSTSTQVSYAMNAPPGTYWLFAFLDDNSNATTFPPPVPDAVDLATSSAPQVKIVAGQALTQDLVLDTLGGYAPLPDGGTISITGLKGALTASVSPSLDGKGTIFISLHNQLPPKGQVASAAHQNGDLSSPFAQEMYFLGNLQPGQYYLRIFLDDNANAKPFNLAPDKGDLVHASPVQVHVVGGAIGIYDVVLDQVQP